MAVEDNLYGVSIEKDGQRIDPREFYMTERKCRNCAWWGKTEHGSVEHLPCSEPCGECHYNAPEASMGFPCVFPDDWCRHWSADTGWVEGLPEPPPPLDVWQPIETAPKDGTDVLVCRAYDADGKLMDYEAHCLFTHRAAWWDEQGWVTYNSQITEKQVFFEPTHWMPVPELKE